MRLVHGSRIAIVCLVAGASVLAHATLWAQGRPDDRTERATSRFSPGLGGALGAGDAGAGAAAPTEPPVATVHLASPVTAAAARTWLKLQEPVAMRFSTETPLEAVLKHVRDSTKGKESKGIPFYVDPVGLQEAEKTLTSPVQLDVEDVPLATSLKLLLKQLGLIFYVQPDGLVVITNEGNDDRPEDPSTKILDELSALRMEVAALRRDLNLTPRGR